MLFHPKTGDDWRPACPGLRHSKRRSKPPQRPSTTPEAASAAVHGLAETNSGNVKEIERAKLKFSKIQSNQIWSNMLRSWWFCRFSQPLFIAFHLALLFSMIGSCVSCLLTAMAWPRDQQPRLEAGRRLQHNSFWRERKSRGPAVRVTQKGKTGQRVLKHPASPAGSAQQSAAIAWTSVQWTAKLGDHSGTRRSNQKIYCLLFCSQLLLSAHLLLENIAKLSLQCFLGRHSSSSPSSFHEGKILNCMHWNDFFTSNRCALFKTTREIAHPWQQPATRVQMALSSTGTKVFYWIKLNNGIAKRCRKGPWVEGLSQEEHKISSSLQVGLADTGQIKTT